MFKEDGHDGLIDRWVYFHALLADSRLPVYILQTKGKEPSSFQISKFDNEGNINIVPRVINFDPADLLPAAYLDYDISDSNSGSEFTSINTSTKCVYNVDTSSGVQWTVRVISS